jgi:hypothetical protein
MPRPIPPAYAGGAKRARTDGGAPTPEQALVEWALAGGAELAGIVIAAGPESNSARGFVAAQDTPAQACVLKLPHALVLSTSVALEAAVGQCITQHPGLRVLTESSVEEERLKWEQESEAQAPQADDNADPGLQVVTARSVLYAYLIHQRWVEAGDCGFTAYARALPAAYSTPFTWPRAELERHTDLLAEVESLETHLRGQYEALFPLLSKGEESAALFPAAIFTREAWLWAHNSFQTRCFPRFKTDPAGCCSAPVEEQEDGVLLPLIDMLNHDHSGCNAVLRTGVGGPECVLGGSDGRAVHVHNALLKKGEPLLYSCT